MSGEEQQAGVRETLQGQAPPGTGTSRASSHWRAFLPPPGPPAGGSPGRASAHGDLEASALLQERLLARWYNHTAQNWTAWVRSSAQPLASCVTRGQSLNPSVPRLLHLFNEHSNQGACPTGAAGVGRQSAHRKARRAVSSQLQAVCVTAP